MSVKERIQKYLREKSAFRISTDFIFYLFILAILLPVSRKYVATGLNKAVMHRPGIINAARQITLSDADYEWMLLGLDGTPVSFSSFKGEPIFLSLWATWCPPCRAEMPNIQRLYDEYGERLNMILASQEEAGQLQRFLTENGYNLPVYRLVQNLPEKLQANSIPTTYMITGDGKITVKKSGAARWDGNYFKTYLERVLEE